MKLQQKEKQQQQKLEKITKQRSTIEKRLNTVIRKYNRFVKVYQQEKERHESQLETLYQEQIDREAQIGLLLDEQKANEGKLLEEVETLRHAKAELEQKIERLQQHEKSNSWAVDSDLLQVIEKQNQYIQELKDRAHQRSTMLRAENESLRQELEHLSSAQEKASWEKQMLESSLKDLQMDLAEYIQLKNRFEEVQHEKQQFEEIFQRRIQFLEEQQADVKGHTPPLSSKSGEARLIHEESFDEASSSQEARSWFTRFFSKTGKIREWFHLSKPKVLNALVILVIIVLTIAIYRLIPWHYIQPAQRFSETNGKPAEAPAELPDIKLFETEGMLPLEGKHARMKHTSQDMSAPVQTTRAEEKFVSIPAAKMPVRAEPVAPPGQQALEKPVIPQQTPRPARRTVPARPKQIVVRLSHAQSGRFPPEFLENPTVENNLILRRHQAQTLPTSRR